MAATFFQYIAFILIKPLEINFLLIIAALKFKYAKHSCRNVVWDINGFAVCPSPMHTFIFP